jgi:hypothetical protein
MLTVTQSSGTKYLNSRNFYKLDTHCLGEDFELRGSCVEGLNAWGDELRVLMDDLG